MLKSIANNFSCFISIGRSDKRCLFGCRLHSHCRMPTTHWPVKNLSAIKWVSIEISNVLTDRNATHNLHCGTFWSHCIKMPKKRKRERLLLQKLTDSFISLPCECISGMLTMPENARWSCELQAAQGTEKPSIFFGVWNVNKNVILYTLTAYAHAPVNTYPCTHKEESPEVWVFK